MNAQPAPEHVTIEIDGKSMQVAKGSMIIQAADAAGIAIPRFCYHPKLAIAANCRQCMVEVEMGGKMVPKPLPACATPVSDGMKVQTRSENALKWQRNVMEFLLINHPLDCPICDQGGECELQDISLGFGRSISRFTERKRVVADENIGPLIATEMTRCIHCTRCVRFVGEIAGTHELGGMGRGENLEIGTYIGKSIESEIGGNIIDVCPVGALTDKVFQFRARAWELIARRAIASHDALGSNQWLHTLRKRVLRAVPRNNEATNECWLSDRDRYSHQGLESTDRVLKPQIKQAGGWVEADWEAGLAAARDALQSAGNELSILVHPATSCEEGMLLARLAAALGTGNMDHRLRALDVAGARAASFGMAVADMDKADAALLIGSNIRHEVPLLHHRLRKAWRNGGKLMAINPVDFDFSFELQQQITAPPQSLLGELLALVAAGCDSKDLAPELADAVADLQPGETAQAMVAALKAADNSVLVLGEIAAMHPEASWLRAATHALAKATGSAVNEIPLGANAIGLDRVGVQPSPEGKSVRAMQQKPGKAILFWGAELPQDFADGSLIRQAATQADTVVVCSAYANDEMRELADVILPIAATPESAGTMVNVDGLVQSADAAVPPPGEARAGWRVLRALGGQLEADGFDFVDYPGLKALTLPLAETPAANRAAKLGARTAMPSTGLARLATVPIYRGDAVLRRAAALGEHPLSRPAEVVLNPSDATSLGLEAGAMVRLTGDVKLPLRTDSRLAVGTLWVELAHEQTRGVLPMGATISVEGA